MSDVYTLSPNRVDQNTRVRNAMECIANYINLIPEMNVNFIADSFTLSTQKYGAVNDHLFSANCQEEMDTIAKNLETYLRDEDFKSVSVKPAEDHGDGKSDFDTGGYFDLTPMGWGSGVHSGINSGRPVLYTVKATYDYSVKL